MSTYYHLGYAWKNESGEWQSRYLFYDSGYSDLATWAFEQWKKDTSYLEPNLPWDREDGDAEACEDIKNDMKAFLDSPSDKKFVEGYQIYAFKEYEEGLVISREDKEDTWSEFIVGEDHEEFMSCSAWVKKDHPLEGKKISWAEWEKDYPEETGFSRIWVGKKVSKDEIFLDKWRLHIGNLMFDKETLLGLLADIRAEKYRMDRYGRSDKYRSPEEEKASITYHNLRFVYNMEDQLEKIPDNAIFYFYLG